MGKMLKSILMLFGVKINFFHLPLPVH